MLCCAAIASTLDPKTVLSRQIVGKPWRKNENNENATALVLANIRFTELKTMRMT